MLRTAIVIATVVMTAGGTLAQGDVVLGDQVFAERCSSCHSINGSETKRGPDLANLIDRPAASIEGYKYSDAMVEAAQAGLVWDVETLSQFLTKPRKVVNGSTMNLTGISNPDDVANVVAYLASFSTAPAE